MLLRSFHSRTQSPCFESGFFYFESRFSKVKSGFSKTSPDSVRVWVLVFLDSGFSSSLSPVRLSKDSETVLKPTGRHAELIS